MSRHRTEEVAHLVGAAQVHVRSRVGPASVVTWRTERGGGGFSVSADAQL